MLYTIPIYNGEITQEIARTHGILVEYNGNQQTYLISNSQTLKVGALKTGSSSFKETIISLDPRFDYWALQYNAYNGSIITFRHINISDASSFRVSLEVEGVIRYNYQLETPYSSPWVSALVLADSSDSFIEEYSRTESLTNYPITYSATNGTVTGPSEAAVGETVVAFGTPNANYGITDYTTQIAVTCNDIPVPFTFNATTNEITFEMPDPTSG